MTLNTSLGTQSKDVGTSHYYGPMHSGSTLDILENGYTEASKALVPSPSFAFRNKGTAETFREMMDFFVEYTDIGDYVFFASANNKYAFHKADLAKYGMIHSPDEDMAVMDGWIGATVGNHAIESVEPNAEEGLLSLPEHHIDYNRFEMTGVNLPVKHLAGTVPINMVGFYLSKIANLEADLRDVVFENYFVDGVGFNSETEAWLEFLLDRGFGPAREIGAVGVENMEEGYAAGTYPNGTAVLVASKNIDEFVSFIAEAYGLNDTESYKAIKRYVLDHELFHVLDRREGLTNDPREVDVGELLAEFYSEMAETGGEKSAKYYRALRDFNVQYATEYREGRQSQDSLSSSKLEALVSGYDSEAKKLGLKGEEAKDYVATKLGEYVSKSGEESEGSEAKQEAKNSKYSNKRAATKSGSKDSGDDSSDGTTEAKDDAEDDGGEGDGGGEE